MANGIKYFLGVFWGATVASSWWAAAIWGSTVLSDDGGHGLWFIAGFATVVTVLVVIWWFMENWDEINK